MVYKEILLSDVLPNPFQTRKKVDEEEIERLAETIDSKIGLRNAPMVRPSSERPGYYELASGWRRILAARKKGIEKTVLRVENLSDSDMKREVLVENTTRVNLSDDELFQALEQIRQDTGLDLNDEGFYKEMATIAGLSSRWIQALYERNELKKEIKEDIPASLTIETYGLGKEDRIALIKKATSEDWSQRKVRDTKTALRQLEPEIREELLKPDTKISPRVIQELPKIRDSETQKAIIKETTIRRLNEDDSLRLINRIRDSKEPQRTILVNEPQEVMRDFQDTMQRIQRWGINQYGILGPLQWQEACQYFSKIEEQMRWLRNKGWKKQ